MDTIDKIQKLKSDLKLNYRKILILLISLGAFSFHFLIGWQYSFTGLPPDTLVVVLEPIFNLLSGVWEANKLQMNFYTGNPFFISPIVVLFDGIIGIRAAFISFMGLSTVFCYWSYRELFSFKEGIVALLVLLGMCNWLLFRYVDYSYTLMLSSIILLIFIKWDLTGKINYFYILSFISALFFYFKAITAYVTAGLVIGKLLQERKEFFEFVTHKRFNIATILFLIGLSPALYYWFDANFAYIYRLLDFEQIYTNVEFNPFDLLLMRLGNLNAIIAPRTYIGFTEAISYKLNIYSVGTIVGFIAAFFNKEFRKYSLSFILVLLMTIYVLNNVSFKHVYILIPLIPIFVTLLLRRIIGYACQYRDFLDRDKLEFILIVILLINLALTTFYIDSVSLTTNRSPDYYISQDLYEEYQNLNVSGYMATNDYHAYALSIYDTKDIKESYYLTPNSGAPNNFTRTLIAPLDPGRRDIGNEGHEELTDYEPKINSTLILLNDFDDGCDYDLRTCGFTSEKIIEEYEISEKQISYIQLNNLNYTIVRNANPIN